MGFDPRDHAARLREQKELLEQVDTSNILQPDDYPWASPRNDETGFPEVLYRQPNHREYELFYQSVAATTGIALQVDRRPEAWAVSVVNIANTRFRIYQAEAAYGLPIELGPGGTCKIPAVGSGRYLYLFNAGSTTGVVNAWALSSEYILGIFSVGSGA